MQLPRSDILDIAHFSRLFDNKSECYKLFWFQAIARKIKEGHKMMSNYYESNAERYAAETFSADMSEQYQRFLPLLKDGAKILDVGSGSGRDACYFQKHGYQVTALESSKNLCREIRKVFSGEIACSDIQNYQPAERYDGIWACASLIHLQEEEVLCFFRKIDLYLNDNGIVYASGKNGIPTGEAEEKDFGG